MQRLLTSDLPAHVSPQLSLAERSDEEADFAQPAVVQHESVAREGPEIPMELMNSQPRGPREAV